MSSKPCVVLIVDDERDTVRLLQMLFERHGFVVRVAHSIAGALAAVEEAPIDLLVSDVRLPDGDAGALLQALRSKGLLHAIAISATDHETEIRRCLDGGFGAFLGKPLAFGDLLTTIERLQGG